jgi:hypothetical protein
MDCFLITAPIFIATILLSIHVGKRSVRRNLENYIAKQRTIYNPEFSTYHLAVCDEMLRLESTLKTRRLVFDWQSKGEI